MKLQKELQGEFVIPFIQVKHTLIELNFVETDTAATLSLVDRVAD